MKRYFKINTFIYSYMAVFMSGSVGAGDSKAVHAMHVYWIATLTSGALWLLSRYVTVHVKISRTEAHLNPNFDFRDSSVWDETPIQESVGDLLPSQKALGISAVIITFVVAILVVI